MFIKKDSGLSLIGVLIAIYITGMGLVSVLALANMSIKGSYLGETRLIASGLAQEGVEIVRDIRRSNSDWINWEWYGTIATSTSQNFLVQYDNEDLISFSETPLKIDSNGFYQYDSGSNSNFYRKVTLTKKSFEEVRVMVEIKWKLKGDWYYLIVEDHLWKWKY
ncbi:hypothetical protein KKH07_02845 [Patescibacteria group bacterium]|nr:hypothetical protein [Patescibacteria group bacterium]MBU1563926.1 hypothetical protein [Patescibacteria group bacterium]MBU2068606.1 hypothetical protein [Patescibacteria group bacterium]